MAEIVTMGEMLCEIMRTEVGIPLNTAGIFKGPFPSGAPGIFIDTVARLEHTAAIISGVGEDDFGECILERLQEHGVDCSYVLRCKEGSTGVAFVTYFEDGSRKFLYHFSNTPATVAQMPKMDDFANTRFFHIMGCSLMANDTFAEEILKTMRAFKKLGAEITFDPNIRKELLAGEETENRVWEVMKSSSIFLPGVSELLFLTKKKTEKEAVELCFEQTNMQMIIVKNGSKGSSVYTRSEYAKLGVYPAHSVDATGAGDSFDAAFLCGILDGMDIKKAALYASAAAALNTEGFGPMEGDISRRSIQNKMMQTMI